MVEKVAIHVVLLDIAADAAVGIIEVGKIENGRSAVVQVRQSIKGMLSLKCEKTILIISTLITHLLNHRNVPGPSTILLPSRYISSLSHYILRHTAI